MNENPINSNDPNQPVQPNQPPQNLSDESNKFNSEYHQNNRLDVKPTIRLDATPPDGKKPGIVGPALVVLQWLTYAFWGGTVISMSVLTAALLSFHITGSSFGDSASYSIAAVLVLLPISIICDIIYGKQEPDRKSGIASVVMIIHAVTFGLFVIGSVISVAFSIVTLMISGTDTDGTMVSLWSSLIIAFLFALVFLRTVLPNKLSGMKRYYIILMTVIVGVITVLGLIGPVNDARLSRNDRLIESGLPTVGDAIEAYVTSKSKLPDDLKNLDLKGDAKKLVADNLVRYTQETPPQSLLYPDYPANATTLYYKLCVTYRKASPSQTDYNVTSSSSSVDSGYSSYISTYSHPAGEKCYKLKTSGSSYETQSNSESSIFN